ncbi:hypothetical protein LCGC14_0423600 [marine sediment metagenome]|uniref:Uncharacterized protein n=1 Tax=marine sediment metagenome TaxID=412755 RepID=A0A0F9T897_9ZZZZ
MPVTNPKGLTTGGIRGIQQIVARLAEYNGDQPNAKFGGTQSLFLYTDVHIEKAGKVTTLDNNRLTDYLNESDEANSKWAKTCAIWISFGVEAGFFENDDDPKIMEDDGRGLFEPFIVATSEDGDNKMIRFEKRVIIEGNSKISPGLAFVPVAFVEEGDIQESVYGVQATSQESLATVQRNLKKEISEEALVLVTEALANETDGLDKSQVKALVMTTSANRTIIIRVGGIEPVLDEAVAQGRITFADGIYASGVGVPLETEQPNDDDGADSGEEPESEVEVDTPPLEETKPPTTAEKRAAAKAKAATLAAE